MTEHRERADHLARILRARIATLKSGKIRVRELPDLADEIQQALGVLASLAADVMRLRGLRSPSGLSEVDTIDHPTRTDKLSVNETRIAEPGAMRSVRTRSNVSVVGPYYCPDCGRHTENPDRCDDCRAIQDAFNTHDW